MRRALALCLLLQQVLAATLGLDLHAARCMPGFLYSGLSGGCIPTAGASCSAGLSAAYFTFPGSWLDAAARTVSTAPALALPVMNGTTVLAGTQCGSRAYAALCGASLQPAQASGCTVTTKTATATPIPSPSQRASPSAWSTPSASSSPAPPKVQPALCAPGSVWWGWARGCSSAPLAAACAASLAVPVYVAPNTSALAVGAAGPALVWPAVNTSSAGLVVRDGGAACLPRAFTAVCSVGGAPAAVSVGCPVTSRTPSATPSSTTSSSASTTVAVASPTPTVSGTAAASGSSKASGSAMLLPSSSAAGTATGTAASTPTSTTTLSAGASPSVTSTMTATATTSGTTAATPSTSVTVSATPSATPSTTPSVTATRSASTSPSGTPAPRCADVKIDVTIPLVLTNTTLAQVASSRAAQCGLRLAGAVAARLPVAAVLLSSVASDTASGTLVWTPATQADCAGYADGGVSAATAQSDALPALLAAALASKGIGWPASQAVTSWSAADYSNPATSWARVGGVLPSGARTSSLVSGSGSGVGAIPLATPSPSPSAAAGAPTSAPAASRAPATQLDAVLPSCGNSAGRQRLLQGATSTTTATGSGLVRVVLQAKLTLPVTPAKDICRGPFAELVAGLPANAAALVPTDFSAAAASGIAQQPVPVIDVRAPSPGFDVSGGLLQALLVQGLTLPASSSTGSSSTTTITAGASLQPRPSQGAVVPFSVACLAADPVTLAAALAVAAPAQTGSGVTTSPAPSNSGVIIGAAAGGGGLLLAVGVALYVRSLLRAKRRLRLMGSGPSSGAGGRDGEDITTLVVPGRAPKPLTVPGPTTAAISTLNPITAAMQRSAV